MTCVRCTVYSRSGRSKSSSCSGSSNLQTKVEVGRGAVVVVVVVVVVAVSQPRPGPDPGPLKQNYGAVRSSGETSAKNMTFCRPTNDVAAVKTAHPTVAKHFVSEKHKRFTSRLRRGSETTSNTQRQRQIVARIFNIHTSNSPCHPATPPKWKFAPLQAICQTRGQRRGETKNPITKFKSHLSFEKPSLSPKSLVE